MELKKFSIKNFNGSKNESSLVTASIAITMAPEAVNVSNISKIISQLNAIDEMAIEDITFSDVNNECITKETGGMDLFYKDSIVNWCTYFQSPTDDANGRVPQLEMKVLEEDDIFIYCSRTNKGTDINMYYPKIWNLCLAAVRKFDGISHSRIGYWYRVNADDICDVVKKGLRKRLNVGFNYLCALSAECLCMMLIVSSESLLRNDDGCYVELVKDALERVKGYKKIGERITQFEKCISRKHIYDYIHCKKFEEAEVERLMKCVETRTQESVIPAGDDSAKVQQEGKTVTPFKYVRDGADKWKVTAELREKLSKLSTQILAKVNRIITEMIRKQYIFIPQNTYANKFFAELYRLGLSMEYNGQRQEQFFCEWKELCQPKKTA